MEIEISTSDPEVVDPAFIASLIRMGGLHVRTVSVNNGERQWHFADTEPDFTPDHA